MAGKVHYTSFNVGWDRKCVYVTGDRCSAYTVHWFWWRTDGQRRASSKRSPNQINSHTQNWYRRRTLENFTLRSWVFNSKLSRNRMSVGRIYNFNRGFCCHLCTTSGYSLNLWQLRLSCCVGLVCDKFSEYLLPPTLSTEKSPFLSPTQISQFYASITRRSIHSSTLTLLLQWNSGKITVQTRLYTKNIERTIENKSILMKSNRF